MREENREIILELLCREKVSGCLPETIATDSQAVDWLFYILHEVEFPDAALICFLRKHHADDHRFKLWLNRALLPNLGEDGMVSSTAFKHLQASETDHPWLDSFVEQAAYEFASDIEFMSFGKDFRDDLKERYARLVGDPHSVPDVFEYIEEVDTDVLQNLAEETRSSLKERLAAFHELAERENFEMLF